MFDLGMQELVVIFVVALLVFGPKRLPELGRTIGKFMGQLRTVMSDVKAEVDREIHMAERDLDINELPAWKKRPGEAAEEEKPKVTPEDVQKARSKALEEEKMAQAEASGTDADEAPAAGPEREDDESDDYRETMPEDLEDSRADEGPEKEA